MHTHMTISSHKCMCLGYAQLMQHWMQETYKTVQSQHVMPVKGFVMSMGYAYAAPKETTQTSMNSYTGVCRCRTSGTSKLFLRGTSSSRYRDLAVRTDPRYSVPGALLVDVGFSSDCASS